MNSNHVQLKKILREKEGQLLEQLEQQEGELDDMKGQLIREKRKQMDQQRRCPNNMLEHHPEMNNNDTGCKSLEVFILLENEIVLQMINKIVKLSKTHDVTNVCLRP